jgi:hypothetical protein
MESDISHKIYREELSRIRELFGSNGIRFVLLKGMSIEFGEPRDMGDLDILVGKEQLSAAASALNEIGYKYNRKTNDIKVTNEQLERIELQLSWNTQFGFYNPDKRLLVELHTNLFEKKYVYKENLDPLLSRIGSCWERRIPDPDLGCEVLSIEDRLVLTCMHLAIKRSPQQNLFILRQAIDIKNILARMINDERFLSIVVSFGMELFVAFSLEFTMRMFDMPQIAQLVSRLKHRLRKSELFLNRIHFRCFSGFDRSSMLYSKLYRYLMPFVTGGRTIDKLKSIIFFDILFPPKFRMEMLFNISRKSGFFFAVYLLNPIRCIFLFMNRLLRQNAFKLFFMRISKTCSTACRWHL